MRTFLLLLVGLWGITAQAQPRGDDWDRVVDLRGQWLFQIGDNPEWAHPTLFDKEWDNVFVPATWEEEGFWGYDGYAWYRTHFELPASYDGRSLYLYLGRIDDTDAVYVNGHYLGTTGQFPPHYKTGFHQIRNYPVPARYLNPEGRNVIAVRVFDEGREGGIIEGRVGLYSRMDEPALRVDLAGPWLLKGGDRMEWRDPDLVESGWSTIHVPGRWEDQGFERLDDYAWYRTHFYLPGHMEKEELVLVLGKIDDLDETFMNGVLVGKTGNMRSRRVEGHEWQEIRVYPLNREFLQFGAENTIAVRVFDGLEYGGIFEGPVGITTRREAERWIHQNDDDGWNFWERVFKQFWEEKE